MSYLCIICRELLEAKNVVATPCGHIFHMDFLEECIRMNSTCPYCRSPNARNFIKLYKPELAERKEDLVKIVECYIRHISDECKALRTKLKKLQKQKSNMKSVLRSCKMMNLPEYRKFRKFYKRHLKSINTEKLFTTTEG